MKDCQECRLCKVCGILRTFRKLNEDYYIVDTSTEIAQICKQFEKK